MQHKEVTRKGSCMLKDTKELTILAALIERMLQNRNNEIEDVTDAELDSVRR